MKRSSVALLAALVAVATQLACDIPTAPLGPCETSSKAFSAVPPAFVARVSKIDYEQGIAPGGSEVSNYLLELTIPSAANPEGGVFVKRGTPIFARSPAGAVTSVTACSIKVGTTVEVSHDESIGYSGIDGTPPTAWYYATQLVIVR